jgi:proteic killer suppression protein
VILSFGERATHDLFHGGPRGRALPFPADILRTAVRKLDILNAAHSLLDLRSPPGNRLESLRGDMQGWHSIRVNDQWRFVFRWTPDGPTAVRLVDYH